ncbi:MAG: hypothetical protein NC253_05435 [Ruminococcus sp.]|nr:hypothetical protein [Ruminococcus sp.]MCM1382210.1 hypothetical protein [Muribaculaceae bacterium]MCM1478224.1 hypothetical protein [Muribaculaceae bacterium]
MKAFGAFMLAITSAAAGAAAAAYAMKKREEIEQYDYDFDDDDETYFDECDCCGDEDDMSELDSLDSDVDTAAETSDKEDF